MQHSDGYRDRRASSPVVGTSTWDKMPVRATRLQNDQINSTALILSVRLALFGRIKPVWLSYRTVAAESALSARCLLWDHSRGQNSRC